MVPPAWTMLWSALAVLGAAAGIGAYLRRRRVIDATRPRIDDDAVRTILATGSLTLEEDEPLDMSSIEAEEERFWSETWDEPEDFRT